jgi:hypothetical protein
MINAIPLVGWIISFFLNASLAIPFWFLWRVCGIGDTYFYWLPEAYRSIGFWSTIGLFMVLSILKTVLTPKLVWVNNSSESGKK